MSGVRPDSSTSLSPLLGSEDMAFEGLEPAAPEALNKAQRDRSRRKRESPVDTDSLNLWRRAGGA